MTPSDIAREAIRLVRIGWTRLEPATDANGNPCRSWGDGPAIAWSLVGSISGAFWDRVGLEPLKMMVLGRLRVLTRETRCESLFIWNERHGSQDAVVALLTDCIQDGVKPCDVSSS